MDPKTLASLDPKLRETYERVMGTGSVSGNNPALSPQTDAPAVIPTSPAADLPTANSTSPMGNMDNSGQEQLSTANPFAAPDFEAVNTNPASSSSSGSLNTSSFAATTPEVNPDGLSSTPRTPSDANPFAPTAPGTDAFVSPFVTPNLNSQAQAPLPTIGSNTVDMSAFNLNPMGQKTDSSIPADPVSEPAVSEALAPEVETAPPAPLQAIGVPVAQPKPASPMTKFLYIFAGVIFFLIYTFFWLKLFKFPLPF